MNKSDYMVGFLNANTQTAWKAKAGTADEGEAPKDKDSQPVSANVALLKRVERIIFSTSVTTLPEAASRLRTLIETIDDEENEAKKKPV
jgi:hypothetical protein